MKALKYIAIFGFTFILLFPLYWMFRGSVDEIAGVMRVPPTLLPMNWTLDNYRVLLSKNLGGGGYGYNPATDDIQDIAENTQVYEKSAILRWTLNTGGIFTLKAALAVFLVATAGYAFGVYRFKGKNTLFLVFIIGIVIGPGITIVPYFVTCERLGLRGNWLGVILPFAYTPVGVYIFRNYVETISFEIVDAARIDGAGEFRILRQVILPLCRPAVGVLVVLVALGTLQDYIWSLLMLPTTEKQTLMVGVIQEILRVQALSGGLNPIGMSLAGGVILFIPLFLVFIFCQRYFIKGLALGGVKE